MQNHTDSLRVLLKSQRSAQCSQREFKQKLLKIPLANEVCLRRELTLRTTESSSKSLAMSKIPPFVRSFITRVEISSYQVASGDVWTIHQFDRLYVFLFTLADNLHAIRTCLCWYPEQFHPNGTNYPRYLQIKLLRSFLQALPHPHSPIWRKY